MCNLPRGFGKYVPTGNLSFYYREDMLADPLFSKYVNGLSSEDSDFRFTCIENLIQLYPEKAIITFIDHYSYDGVYSVDGDYIWALKKIDEERYNADDDESIVRLILCDFLTVKNNDTVIKTMHLISKICPPEYDVVFIPLLKQDDSKILDNALVALNHLGIVHSELVKPIMEIIQTTNSERILELAILTCEYFSNHNILYSNSLVEIIENITSCIGKTLPNENGHIGVDDCIREACNTIFMNIYANWNNGILSLDSKKEFIEYMIENKEMMIGFFGEDLIEKRFFQPL